MPGNNDLYLATGNGSYGIELWTKPSGQTTWTPIGSAFGSGAVEPSIAAYSSGTAKDVYIAWNNNGSLYTRHYDITANTWTSATAVYSSGGCYDHPSIAVDSNSIPVITCIQTSTDTLYLARATNRTGATWRTNEQQSLTISKNIYYSGVALDGSNTACIAHTVAEPNASNRIQVLTREQ